LQANISIIIYIPYKFNKNEKLFNIVNKTLTYILSNHFIINRIKFRIMDTKAVSSYAVYDSVYGYCPEDTMVVSSRHNVQFSRNFIAEILHKVEENYHYYLINTQDYLGQITKFDYLLNP
jgi:hypothetical protein